MAVQVGAAGQLTDERCRCRGAAPSLPRQPLTERRFHGLGADMCWRSDIKTGAGWQMPDPAPVKGSAPKEV